MRSGRWYFSAWGMSGCTSLRRTPGTSLEGVIARHTVPITHNAANKLIMLSGALAR